LEKGDYEMKVSVIGGGTMGEALIQSLIRKKVSAKEDVTVADVFQARLDALKKKYGIRTTTSNLEAIKSTDVIILAVKPQDLGQVLEQISGNLKLQVVISIVAGATLETICSKLNYRRVVRSMPNTPAQVGMGMTVWTGTKQITEKDISIAKAVLSSMGEEHYFAEEKYLDMSTALSGSGPAYVFLFIESLIDAGVHIGLPRNIAQKLVIETLAGSIESVRKSLKHPAELKNMVTSPGGTTTEALFYLERGGMRSLIMEAVMAAYQKAKSLGAK
jgi:pyrroline-5-carboxylate reductase